jgi:hypothetical protein
MPSKPGAPQSGTGGVPSDFEYLNDERLPTNPAITRMPTNQREWDAFVRELDKRIKNISDGFVPTFTGFSSDPSNPFVWYHRYGQLVMLEWHFTTGTSNSTSWTITNLPEIITPKYNVDAIVSGMIDNGSNVTHPGAMTVGANGVITFWSTEHHNLFTASGNKGFANADRYTTTYWLRHPSKL